jgi:hypothetical protein
MGGAASSGRRLTLGLPITASCRLSCRRRAAACRRAVPSHHGAACSLPPPSKTVVPMLAAPPSAPPSKTAARLLLVLLVNFVAPPFSALRFSPSWPWLLLLGPVRGAGRRDWGLFHQEVKVLSCSISQLVNFECNC